MKKKTTLIWLFVAAAILLTGCAARETEETGYTVYYVNSIGTRLMESKYSPDAETFDDLMEELLAQLAQPPAGYVSALPDEVSINGYERGIDALRIDFSKEYYDLSNTTEVLLRAAVVKTFSQIPGVMKVMITVEKEQLQDAEGNPVEAMDADSFIDTKEGGINSYQYATLKLYFADSTGKSIMEETRNLHYSSNMVLERVVVEQLIKGPETSSLRSVLDSNVRILNVYVKDGLCTINFSEEVNLTPSDGMVHPQTALYAIVDSIFETCDGITGVKFEIDGDSDVKFRDSVDLNRIFTLDQSYIEQEESSGETAADEEAVKEQQTEASTDLQETDNSGENFISEEE